MSAGTTNTSVAPASLHLAAVSSSSSLRRATRTYIYINVVGFFVCETYRVPFELKIDFDSIPNQFYEQMIQKNILGRPRLVWSSLA